MDEYEKTLAFWRKKEIRTAAQLAEALHAHSIAFAYHSGRLENANVTYFDTREIFEHDSVSGYTGDLRTLFEIRNARDAHELLLTAFQQRRALDEPLLKRIQFLLTRNTYDARRWQLGERPGTYKRHDFVTGRLEIGAAPEEVEAEMSELLSELDGIGREQALTAGAYFHAKLENIHPFADGNGRTGRLAMNYLLLLHDHPPVILHEEDRRDYYAALEAWDARQTLAPLTEYLRDQTVKTWEKQRARIHG